jgi:hypothetical protein
MNHAVDQLGAGDISIDSTTIEPNRIEHVVRRLTRWRGWPSLCEFEALEDAEELEDSDGLEHADLPGERA